MNVRPFWLALACIGPAVLPPAAEAQSWTAAGGGGGRIAFVLKRESISQICVAAADGSSWQKLTPESLTAYDPHWSPDGAKILFVGKQHKKTSVCVMDADGGNRRTLADVGDANFWPTWSPDGRQIAFVSCRDAGNEKYPTNHLEVYVMNADGSNIRRLAPGELVDTMSWAPQWSPDGTQILFIRTPAGAGARISAINADGTSLRTVAEAPSASEWYSYALWSPDGRSIWCGKDPGGDIIVMDPDGGNPRTIVSGGMGHRLALSPDGTKAALAEVGGDTVEIRDTDGSTVARISQGKGDYNFLFWAPDSQTVGFSYAPVVPASTFSHFFIAGADGSDLRQIDEEADTRALVTAAEQATAGGDFAQAAADYAKAVAADPHDPSLRDRLGESYLAAQDYENAADAFLARDMQYPVQGRVQSKAFELAAGFDDRGQYDTGLVFLLKCQEWYTGKYGSQAIWPDLERELGRAYLAKGNDDLAAAAYARSLSARDLPTTRVFLAQAYLGSGQFEKAAAAAAPAATPLAPGESITAPGGGIYASCTTRAYAFVLLGVARRQLGDSAGARDAFEQATRLDPTIAAAQWLLGEQETRAGNADQAIAPLQRAAALDPSDAKAYEWLGQAQFLKGNCAQAAQLYETAHGLDPTNANLCTWLGLFYRLQGQTGRAGEVAQEGILLAPDDPQFYQDAAEAALAQARYDDAAALLGQGAAVPAGSALAHYRDYVQLLQAGIGLAPAGTLDWDFQLTYWSKVGGWSPWHQGLGDDTWNYYQSRAQAAEMAGNLYSALQLYTWLFRNARTYGDREVARLEAARAKILALYPRLAVKPGVDALARDLARKAQAQAQLSVQVSTGNRFDSAEKFYLLALDEAPWWADGYFNLAIAEHARDTTESFRSAVAALQHYLALTSDAAARAQANRLIAQWEQGPSLGGGRP